MGHVFVVRGDITQLNCDAWALPTDPSGLIEPGWLANAPESLRTSGRTRLELDAAAREGLDHRGAARLTAWDRCVLLDVGRSEQQETKWYAGRLDLFLEVARAGEQVTSRDRPLYAVPLIGTRAAGGAEARGAIIEALLERLEERARDGEFDVVVVARGAGPYAACQHARRRLPNASRWHEIADHETTILQLARRANAGELVVFFGAGASAGSGLPAWDDLLARLADEGPFDEAQKKALRDLDVLDRARVISDRFSAEGLEFGPTVAGLLGDGRYGLVHGLLSCMPVDEFTTTNYDELFETASAAADRPVKVLPYQRLNGRERWLLKMHGTIKEPQDIVLTRDQFLDYPAERGALRGIVQALLITRHMLFVGFSLRDHNFLSIVHDVRRALSKPQPPDEKPFGTLLALRDDPAREMLWQKDLMTVSFGPPLGDPYVNEVEDREDLVAGRQLELFLDRLLFEAGVPLSFMLDPAMAGLLEEDQKAALGALAPLIAAQREAPPDSPTWKRIGELLDDFGLRSDEDLERDRQEREEWRSHPGS